MTMNIPCSLLFSNGHLYLSGVWLVVDLRMSSKKAQNLTTCSEFVNHSRLNSLHHWGVYEENGYEHDLDLLIILH